MLLRTGLVSVGLLLLSRLLGVLRDMAQAAVLGVSGAADVALLVLSLPDLLTGLLVAGALSYVLLPLWAGQGAQQQVASQGRVARGVVLLGAGVAAAMVLQPTLITSLLAPGLSPSMQQAAHMALRWSALSVPLAMLAALWVTRLQHGRDFVGMFGANLIVNMTLLGVLLWLGWVQRPVVSLLGWLGAGLLLAMVLRLGWLQWRMRRRAPQAGAAAAHMPGVPLAWPAPQVWLWALASAGLPLLLPLLARSVASAGAEGALATFSYAWKLVELPLVLLVQLVATLAFPAIAQAVAVSPGGVGPPQDARPWVVPLRGALVLAWVLACASVAALLCGTAAVTQLLFGWGRMPPEALAQVAAWGRAGAWSLLPQAWLAVLLTLMASTGRMRGAVWAYLAALALFAGLAVVAPAGLGGQQVMWLLNAALATAAAVVLWRERAFVRGALPWRDWLPPVLVLGGLAWGGVSESSSVQRGLLTAALAAGLVVGVTWVVSPGLRRALRR